MNSIPVITIDGPSASGKGTKGIRLEFITITEDGQLDLDSYRTLLELNPRRVAFTHMSNVLGTVNPAAEMVKLAHAAGAVTLIDGAQSVPHLAVEVQALDADFLAFSAHKMVGPTGIGILYGKTKLRESMPPFLGGGDMIKRVHLRSFIPNEIPYKFEAGTPAIAEAAGFGAAVDYLSTAGMSRIAAYEPGGCHEGSGPFPGAGAGVSTLTGRYSRQELFAGIGPRGQERIRAAAVTVVGCGALGSALAETMARAGVATLRIVDRDFVEASNLARQALFEEEDAVAALPKAVAAERRLRRVNSEVRVEAVVADLVPDNAAALLGGAQVVLDGTDNFETRILLNDVCLRAGVPWIYGACVGAYGLALAVRPGFTPCLRCVLQDAPPPGSLPTCDTAGLDIGAELYDLWLDTLLETVKECDPQFSPEVERAWERVMMVGISYLLLRYGQPGSGA